jgi:hypothetical protein
MQRIFTTIAFAILLVMCRDMRAVQAQSISSVPAVIMAGIGSPASNGYPCNLGIASSTSTSLYNQRDITAGNSVWKCALGTDGVTFTWIAPFSTPINGTTVSIGGALILLGGSVTGTGTVANAPVGSNCVATPSDGSFLPVGIAIDCAVLTSGVATVRLSAVIAGTPPAKTYNVRVIL